MARKSLISRLSSEKYQDRLESKIELLGEEKFAFTKDSFIGFRILSSVLVFLLVIYLSALGYILAPFITLVYYILFEFVILDKRLEKRAKRLDREALHFFEILTLTLESGKNLENALEVTCFNVDSELSNEFKKALFEMKFGKTLLESLDSMKKRIPSEAVLNILLNITQTDIFGSSILETMNSQVEFLREKQILEIKEQIGKIPNKISIVSVIFIVPLIMIMILGPIIINLISQGTIG